MNKYCWTILVLCVLLLVASFSMAKEYEPNVIHNSFYDFRLNTQSKPITYFRIPPIPHFPNSTFFEITFQACSGKIRIYHSQCVEGSQGCDDGSDKWYPDATNAQATSFTSLGHLGQEVQTFGRQHNDQPENLFHYYGVQIVEADYNGEVIAQAMFRKYNVNSVAHTFTSKPTLSLVNSKTLSWAALEYCLKAKSDDPNTCEAKLPIDPVKYTVFLYKQNAKENINLATSCGLLIASKNIKQVTTSKSATNLALDKYLSGNGDYFVGVGADVPTERYSVEYAYTPIALSYMHTTTTSYKPFWVVFILGLIGAIVGGGAAAAFYFYKKRAGGYETVPLT